MPIVIDCLEPDKSDLLNYSQGQRIVFLDRDGTINYENPEKQGKEPVEIIPGSAQAIRMLKDAGFYIVVVSNQPRIGWEVITKEDFIKICQQLSWDLYNTGRATFDLLVFCSHDDNGGCPWRKPSPVMLQLVSEKTGCDLTDTTIIGDSHRDVFAGQAVGAKTILVQTTNIVSRDTRLTCSPDHIATNLLEAVKILLSSRVS